MPNKPEKVFKVGAVRASVFNNTIQQRGKDVTIAKIVIEVRYKDQAGNWKGTNSLSLNETPKAILALQMAYQWLTTGRDWSEAWNTPWPKDSVTEEKV